MIGGGISFGTSAAAGGVDVLEATYRSFNTNTANTSGSYTITMSSFGPTDTNRWIIAVIGVRDANGNTPPLSVTIGGITAKCLWWPWGINRNETAGVDYNYIGYYAAKVPTDADLNVVVDVVDYAQACGVAVFSLINGADELYASRIFDEPNVSSSSYNMAVNLEGGECLIAAAFTDNTGSQTLSIPGGSSDLASNIEGRLFNVSSLNNASSGSMNITRTMNASNVDSYMSAVAITTTAPDRSSFTMALGASNTSGAAPTPNDPAKDFCIGGHYTQTWDGNSGGGWAMFGDFCRIKGGSSSTSGGSVQKTWALEYCPYPETIDTYITGTGTDTSTQSNQLIDCSQPRIDPVLYIPISNTEDLSNWSEYYPFLIIGDDLGAITPDFTGGNGFEGAIIADGTDAVTLSGASDVCILVPMIDWNNAT